MTTHIDMNAVMLDVLTTMSTKGLEVSQDAFLAYRTRDPIQRVTATEITLEGIAVLRDKLNDLLAQAAQAAHREAA